MGCFGGILLTSATNKEVQGLLVGAAVGPDLLGPEPQEALQETGLDNHGLVDWQINFWKT